MNLSTRVLLAHLGRVIAGNATETSTHDPLSLLSLDWSFESPNMNDVLASNQPSKPEAQHPNLPIFAPHANSQLASPAGLEIGNDMDGVLNDIHLGASLAPVVPHDWEGFHPDTHYGNLLQNRFPDPIDHDLPISFPRYEFNVHSPASSLDNQEKLMSHILQSDGRTELSHPLGTWRRHKEHHEPSVAGIPPAWVSSSSGVSFDFPSQGSPSFDTRYPPIYERYGEYKDGLPSYSQLLVTLSPKKRKLNDHFMDSQTHDHYPSERQFLGTVEYTGHPPMGNSDPLDRLDHWQDGSSSKPGVNFDGKERSPQNEMIEQADRSGFFSHLIDDFDLHTNTDPSPQSKKNEIFKFDVEAFENKGAIGNDKARINIIKKLIKPNTKLIILDLRSTNVHKKFFHKLSRFQANKNKKALKLNGMAWSDDRRRLWRSAYGQLWAHRNAWYRVWGETQGIDFGSIRYLSDYRDGETDIEKNLLLLLFYTDMIDTIIQTDTKSTQLSGLPNKASSLLKLALTSFVKRGQIKFPKKDVEPGHQRQEDV
ncbi:hypothetical protein MJO28_008878 [Puccinia striiformis f. sp. tritici]|uniref:Uncharacterized protein n=1 Tax=Puccinia striiformis f. sp. tritici TaxID=168172 RepID=A0ACC0EBV7_9BASI|nr:hypothetical protein MJO28_008878 [Puccinia striiformis f. sp. tritici]